MRILNIAATGMAAQQQNIEVIANNIANVSTTGFKRGTAVFADLLYQSERPAGGPTEENGGAPFGMNVGLGVQSVGIQTLQTQGAFTQTGNSLDLALNGDGFFQVQGPNSEILYTRAGSFSANSQGQIVDPNGNLVIPNMTVPSNATSISVSSTGLVQATIGGTTQQTIGQITIAKFVNEAGLQAIGNNNYVETAASGAPKVGKPGDPSYATLQQGYVESSNVDPVKEMTNLIAAQRAYEMNSKVMQAGGDLYSTLLKAV